MAVGDEDYRFKVSVAAMKLLLGRLFSLQYRQIGLDPSAVPEMHKMMISNWSKSALVKSADAAISDVASNDVLINWKST